MARMDHGYHRWGLESQGIPRVWDTERGSMLFFESIEPDQHVDDGITDLWSTSLLASAEDLERLSVLLSSDELRRADQFRFPRHRRRFVVARSFLRSVLASYLSTSPSAVRFRYGEHGKPSVDSPIHFNLSDSSDLAVLGITWGREIGVDIEKLRPKRTDQLAARFFAPSEAELMRSMPVAKKERAFFACWTRKEAYLKARGSGLACPLDRFQVEVDPDAAPRLIAVDDDASEPLRWTMRSIEPGQGYVGTVAVEGALTELRRK